jgi:Skp family chaperone for outer membrane proteins
VKKAIAYASGLALVGAAVQICSMVWAQQPATAPAAPAAQVAAPAVTRVAFINVAKIFQDYEKAKGFSEEIKAIAEPKKKEHDTLVAQIKAWKEYMEKNPGKFQKGSKEYDANEELRYTQGIVNNQRKLEDLNKEMTNLLGEKHKQQYLQLYNEMKEVVQRHAGKNNFQVVLAYVEPTTRDPYDIVNIMRKVQGMDMGGTITSLYAAPGIDITQPVLDDLNAWHRSGQPLSKNQ